MLFFLAAFDIFALHAWGANIRLLILFSLFSCLFLHVDRTLFLKSLLCIFVIIVFSVASPKFQLTTTTIGYIIWFAVQGIIFSAILSTTNSYDVRFIMNILRLFYCGVILSFIFAIVHGDRNHFVMDEPAYLAILVVSTYPIVHSTSARGFTLLYILALLTTYSMFGLVCAFASMLTLTLRSVSFSLTFFIRISLFFVLSSILIWVLKDLKIFRSFYLLFTEASPSALGSFLIDRGGSRADRFLSAVNLFILNSGFGVGFGNFVFLNDPISNPGISTLNPSQTGYYAPAINIFAEFLTEAGIISGLVLFGVLARLVYRYQIAVFLVPIFPAMLFESSYLRPAFWLVFVFAVVVVKSREKTAIRKTL